MISWMTRKWEYGDPEEPWIGGQRSGQGNHEPGDLPSPVFFHYDESVRVGRLRYSR